MKINILIGTMTVFALFQSCSNKESGNKTVLNKNGEQTILADDGKPDKTISYNTDVDGNKKIKTDFVYRATDNTLVKVVFNYDPEHREVSITNNNKTFILEKKSALENETVYEKEDMKATVKGDSIIINQGKNVIELEKTKI